MSVRYQVWWIVRLIQTELSGSIRADVWSAKISLISDRFHLMNHQPDFTCSIRPHQTDGDQSTWISLICQTDQIWCSIGRIFTDISLISSDESSGSFFTRWCIRQIWSDKSSDEIRLMSHQMKNPLSSGRLPPDASTHLIGWYFDHAFLLACSAGCNSPWRRRRRLCSLSACFYAEFRISVAFFPK